MRKILVIALLLCAPLACYALGVNGTGTTEQGKFAVGVEGEYVFERKLDNATVDTSGFGIPIMRVQSKIEDLWRSLVKVSYGLTDYVDIYVKLGAAGFDVSSDAYVNNVRLGHIELESDTAFAYGGGIRAEVPLSQDESPIRLGVDAQCLRHENDVDGTENFTVPLPKANLKGEYDILEWQVAAYLAKSFGGFTPYVGVKASELYRDGHVQYSTPFPPVRVNYDGESKYNFGALVGADLTIGDSWAIGVEGRFVDETAISGKCTFNF